MQLSQLFVYPVKSLRGIAVDRVTVRSGRIVGDREWLLVDEEDRFLHQRDYPNMARLEVSFVEGGIRIDADGMRPLELGSMPTIADAASERHVPLWRRAAAVTPIPKADAWFCEALGIRCHLMAFDPAREGRSVPWFETSSSLQDATPFHLVSADSLADLNQRLAVPVSVQRFRPNLVTSGAPPYAEDTWRVFSIGGLTFRWVKPCTRCAMTMTDHVSGERFSRGPLTALAAYRRVGSEVAFGHYVVSTTPDGMLSVGDRVAIAESTGR